MADFKYSIDMASGLRPKGGRDFPLLKAHDIQVDEDGTRLDEKLALIKSGVVAVGSSESGTIDLAAYPVGTLFVLYDDKE